MMFFSRTDLPVPDGPRMAVMRPFGTSKLMSSSTVWDPNDFVTPRSEMIASSAKGDPLRGQCQDTTYCQGAPVTRVTLPRQRRRRPLLSPETPFERSAATSVTLAPGDLACLGDPDDEHALTVRARAATAATVRRAITPQNYRAWVTSQA